MLIRLRRNTYLDYLNLRLGFFGGKENRGRKRRKIFQETKVSCRLVKNS